MGSTIARSRLPISDREAGRRFSRVRNQQSGSAGLSAYLVGMYRVRTSLPVRRRGYYNRRFIYDSTSTMQVSVSLSRCLGSELYWLNV